MKDYLSPDITDEYINSLPILALAHMGDGVFEVMARYAVIAEKIRKVNLLHKQTVSVVCAAAQACAAKEILPMLDEQERNIFMRGRNSKPKTIPKNALGEDYALATAVEALFGWLYLKGKKERLNLLFDTALNAILDNQSKGS